MKTIELDVSEEILDVNHCHHKPWVALLLE